MSASKIDEKAAMEALESPIIVEQVDLRAEITKGTSSFTQEEIQQAKDIVLATLKEEDIDKYAPSLRLQDNQNDEKIIAVFVGVFDDRVTESGEPIRRTYHIRDGKLTRVIKTMPKK
jgi:hypothetical protein